MTTTLTQPIAVYSAAARAREARRLAALVRRRSELHDLAERAAALLKATFGAERVFLFGSVAGVGVFHEQSDLDLAVEGIAPEDFWRAWAALDRLGVTAAIDLVDLAYCAPSLRDAILSEGVEL